MEKIYSEEIELKAKNGMPMLILSIILAIAGIAAIIAGAILLETRKPAIIGAVILVIGTLYTCICWIPFKGLKILKPQEALVLTLFGKYIGTLKGEGFFFVNPFVSAVNPAAATPTSSGTIVDEKAAVFVKGTPQALMAARVDKKISLKTMTLNNDKQKK